jgi:hypothetical protein
VADLAIGWGVVTGLATLLGQKMASILMINDDMMKDMLVSRRGNST